LIEGHFMNQKSSNTVWHHAAVTRQRREQQNGHRSAVVWFSGLSGSGKCTYRRSGTLWAGRFRSCLMQDEAYVLACYRYIRYSGTDHV
jgi:hypothetical protein